MFMDGESLPLRSRMGPGKNDLNKEVNLLAKLASVLLLEIIWES